MMRKTFILFIFFPLIYVLAFGVPTIASEAPIHPGGPFIPPQGSADSWEDANRSTNMTFQELEEELFHLEQVSKGIMTLDIAGYTQESRALYIAKIGEGPTRMWIQGRIHGREPYGNDVCLELIKSLLSKDKSLLDEMTFWIIPGYNPDGTERYWYGNATPSLWDDQGNPVEGVDLNLDWYREDGTGYSQLESQKFYSAWADFQPHYAIDVHGTWAHYVSDEEGNDTNLMSTFFLGIPVMEFALDPDIWNTSRKMTVVVYDAVKKLGWCNPSRYWWGRVHAPMAPISSMMLGNPGPGGHNAEWTNPAIFIEIRNRIGNKSRGYLIKEGVVAVHAVIDAIVSGELEDADPDRWDKEIPDWGSWLDSSDKWPAPF